MRTFLIHIFEMQLRRERRDRHSSPGLEWLRERRTDDYVNPLLLHISSTHSLFFQRHAHTLEKSYTNTSGMWNVRREKAKESKRWESGRILHRHSHALLHLHLLPQEERWERETNAGDPLCLLEAALGWYWLDARTNKVGAPKNSLSVLILHTSLDTDSRPLSLDPNNVRVS